MMFLSHEQCFPVTLILSHKTHDDIHTALLKLLGICCSSFERCVILTIILQVGRVMCMQGSGQG